MAHVDGLSIIFITRVKQLKTRSRKVAIMFWKAEVSLR